MIRTNTIPSFKIGREWRVTKEALDKYIESLNSDKNG
ncbi:MAG: helix-turn-helix domain-containing protein [Clostridia bacterium]|nr:helix-turn-helix domain-containing protein [Clostridia bacterium]